MAAAERKTRMSEEQAVNLLRNSLLVAGHEMGEGDHWPVIKATAHSIMKDYENLRTERNVFHEVKLHYEGMIRDLEKLCKDSPEELKPEIRSAIAALLEIYTASFTPIDEEHFQPSNEDKAPHIKRAEAIIKTLEDNNEQ